MVATRVWLSPDDWFDACPECGSEVTVWERICFGPRPHNVYRCFKCAWSGENPEFKRREETPSLNVKRFRKKPIEIEAVQVTYDNRFEAAEWCGGRAADAAPSGTIYAPGVLAIDTLEGTMWAQDGDWVIKEPFPTDDRQFYPCKPDIFEQTYEAAE